MGGLGTLLGGTASSVLGFITGGKFWLIAIAIAVAGAGTFGYYQGYSKATSVAEDKLVAAQVEMYAKGVEAQKKFSDGQFAIAQADFDQRYDDLQKQKEKVRIIRQRVDVLVPKVEACFYTPEAMKALNDAVSGDE